MLDHDRHTPKSPTAITKQPVRCTSDPPPRAVLAAAQAYIQAGLSVIPIEGRGTKKPASAVLPIGAETGRGKPHRTWKPFQSRLATPAELQRWFGGSDIRQRRGMAVVCGAVSGNLELIDFDSFEYFEPWRQLVDKTSPGIVEKLVAVQTPRPGIHMYYRCPVIQRNQKLAQLHIQNHETGNAEFKTLIETRGEGGYALIPPSPACCHPTGRLYRYISDSDLTELPTISPDERAVLIFAAQAYNQIDGPDDAAAPRRQGHFKREGVDGRPGDDFNAVANWPDILEPHGWSLEFVGDGGVEHWSRPGKAGSTSATVNYADRDLLYVFSTNAHPLESGRAYTKFSAFAILEHAGDFGAAACDLALKGYGTPQVRRYRQRSRQRRRNPFEWRRKTRRS